MTLQDLIQSYTWLEVRPAVLRLYPGYADSLEGHEQVFNDLKAITPVPSKMRIVVSEQEGLDGEKYIDVSGRDGTLKKDSAPEYFTDKPEGENEESFALEFTDRSEWLSMTIDEQTWQAYTEEDIIAHCLWEMTFCGYSREEITEQRDALRQRVEDVKRERQSQERPDEGM